MGLRGWDLPSTVEDQLAVRVQSGSHWLLYGLCAVLSLHYVTTPLGTDVQINVAFAQQASRAGPFPGTLVGTWTLRGIGYKLVVYVLYVATESLVDYYDKRLFELVYRSGMLLLYLGIVGVGAAVARSRLRRDGYDVRSVAFLVVVCFLTLSHYTAFQPGDLAALLTLLGAAFAIAERPWTTAVAGVVFASLATLKGITILYIPLGYLLGTVFQRRDIDHYVVLAEGSKEWLIILCAQGDRARSLIVLM